MKDNILVGIYNNDTGRVMQVSVPPGSDLMQETERLANGKPWMIVDSSELPDGYFRNAWYWDENIADPVTIDMSKAKDVQRSVINLDVPTMRNDLYDQLQEAILNEDQPQINYLRGQIAKLKNILQDPRIEEAKTPDALKSLTLDYLMNN